MPTREDLKYYQSLPLELKIAKTKDNIREFVREFGVDDVYVSFSGGKDSTVLLDIARKMYPEIEAVFVNTGLEYPEIQKFVKTFNNVRIVTPKMRFRDVIAEYGYPIISKEISHKCYYARKGAQWAIQRNGRNSTSKRTAKKMGKISAKQVCYMIAELFGCCCDYDPMQDTMASKESEWCEKCDRNTPVGECWYRYFKIRNKEREKSENEKK